MSKPSTPRVLAIGIDSAEPTLVKKLIDQGELPSMQALLRRGIWGDVRSPADIGSGAVWPTFMTGRDPIDHGIYSVVPWEPSAMSLVRLTTDHLNPFWEALSRKGYSIGIVDVPFAPDSGLHGGVEIAEWGAHDRVRGQTLTSPRSLHAWLMRTVGEHPLGKSRVEISSPRDWKALRKLAATCQAGVRLRGALMARLLAEWRLDAILAVFTEVHHASHYLWHTLDPAHRASRSAGSGDPAMGSPSLVDIYKEVDHEIGQLTGIMGADAMVLIFSLHGMRATQGIPAILDPLMRALGLASIQRWRRRTWSERRRWAISTIKQAVPNPLRRLYRSALHTALRPPRQRTPLPYDWTTTTAFPVPTDQHGWIRLNLKGREAQGVLSRDHYDQICAQLEQTLRRLSTDTGDHVVKDVLCLARNTGNPPEYLPDLIVHWDDHALANPLRIATPSIMARATGTKFTGQHAPQGFFLLRPAAGQMLNVGASVTAQELHHLIRAGLHA